MASATKTHSEPVYLPRDRRLNLKHATSWSHHHAGWRYVCELVKQNLSVDDGVLFLSAVEDQLLYVGSLDQPWVGFIHQLPTTDLPGFPDLSRLVELPQWSESLPHCKGLWTLSEYNKNFLVKKGVTVPISVVSYPTPMDVPQFDWISFDAAPSPILLHVGEFQRRYQSFYDLRAKGFRKVMLKAEDFDTRRPSLQLNDSVDLIEALSHDEYDVKLTRCILFMDLVDAGANTTIIECIARNTPILVNQVGGIVEYLGADYPLYFSTLEEASQKLRDRELIRRTHQYLKELPKQKFTSDGFLTSITNSSVYRTLPSPPSQQSTFKKRSVSVLLSTYKRLYNLRPQLERLCQQDFTENFEVLVWNNNSQISGDVDTIVNEYNDRLDIRLINSGENYYCMMRLAVPALVHSDLVLVCDDDVMPSPNYISAFINRYRDLNSDVVLCLRGHYFHAHSLDHERPDLAWRHERDFSFFDESRPECEVHFAHADNLLISVRLLREASVYPLTHPEYALVDDYWLSFVLGHFLNIPIIKMQGPELISFTECANDTRIALYHNDQVREQRIRLYIEHMLEGWPDFACHDHAIHL